MKKKLLLFVSIVVVMLLFVMGNLASATDTASALSREISTIAEESYGLVEATSCFVLGGLVYWIKSIL